MILLVSPSKSVMSQNEPDGLRASQPLFQDKTDALVKKLRGLSQKKLTSTLGVSNSLGELNYTRFQAWDDTPKRSALWMYSGDVYNGLNAYSMNSEDITYTQDKLLIMSGLYGLLRPLDRIQPYRLEMKTNFAAGRSKNLYDYWSNTLTQYLSDTGEKTVLMCASREYAKVITDSAPDTLKIVTPRFMQETDDGLKEKGLFAKFGRGSLARYAIDNRIDTIEALHNYTVDGFTYSPELSSDSEIVFIVPKNFSLLGRFTKQ